MFPHQQVLPPLTDKKNRILKSLCLFSKQIVTPTDYFLKQAQTLNKQKEQKSPQLEIFCVKAPFKAMFGCTVGKYSPKVHKGNC